MIVTSCVSCDVMSCKRSFSIWQQYLADLCLAEETRVPLCLTDVGGTITSCGCRGCLESTTLPYITSCDVAHRAMGIIMQKLLCTNTSSYLKIACDFHTAFTLSLDFWTSRWIYTNIYQYLYCITLSKHLIRSFLHTFSELFGMYVRTLTHATRHYLIELKWVHFMWKD